MGFQDGSFNINVINKLNDSSMVRTTSIVSLFYLHTLSHDLILWVWSSTGMGSSNVEPNGRMVLSGLPSARSFLEILSCMNSLSPDKPARSGIILIMVRVHRQFVDQTSKQAITVTQYCDGLRGPLVIYDPNDPHKHL